MSKHLGIGVVALCLALAGCGGSGGGEPTVTQSVHDMLQEELDDALALLMETQTARDTAQAGVTRLTGELATAQTQATRLEGERDTANAEVERLEGLIGVATDTADAAGSASLHARLNHATAEVTRLTGELTAANVKVTTLETLAGDATNPTADSLRGQIAELKVDLAAAEARVTVLTGQLGTAQTELEEETERAEQAEQQQQAQQQQTEQLEEQLTEAEQANLRARASNFNAVLDGPDMKTASVSWMRGGSLMFMPTGTFTRGSAPSVPGGWSRSAGFTRQSGMVDALINDTVYLYSNIQAPGTRAFWKVYGFSEITLDTDTTPTSLARGSAARAKTEIETITNNDMTTTTTTDVTEITVSGSFDSAGGTFSCVSAACMEDDLGDGDVATSAEINTHVATRVSFSEGRPMFTDPGEWTFKPASITSGVPRQQDEAYLYFGIWTSEPVSVAGTPDFGYIAGGGADLGSVNSLTGTAEFRGGAVGKYATQGQVGQQNAKIGSFTATAVLTADFGAADAPGTLSGRITDFREAGVSLANWSVTLGGTDVGVAADIGAGNAPAGNTLANLGNLAVAGSWGAKFYGAENVRTDATAEQTVTRYPPIDLAGVTGWFDATSMTSASLAGAFGAACTTGAMCAR